VDERTPQTSPLDCYAWHYDETQPVCRKCEHNADCKARMGSRLGRVQLSKATFDLMPPKLKSNKPADDLQVVYDLCHDMIFDRRNRSPVHKFAEAIRRNAAQTRHSVKLFIMTNMAAHQEASPERDFYPSALTGEFALDRHNLYAETCVKKFGFLDVRTLSAVTKVNYEEHDYERQIVDTERAVGEWIVRYKLFKPGKPEGPLFDALELKLAPVWLCIEPAYEAIYFQHLKEPFGNKEENRHRFNVTTVMRKLTKAEWRLIFSYREDCLLGAAAHVLSLFGHKLEDFAIVDKPVNNALDFWYRLALAVQHLECLKHVSGEHSVYRNNSRS
jgi:hypothetical protein